MVALFTKFVGHSSLLEMVFVTQNPWQKVIQRKKNVYASAFCTIPQLMLDRHEDCTSKINRTNKQTEKTTASVTVK